ncbi:PAS domain-containing protein, partial [Lactobacillus alvi]
IQINDPDRMVREVIETLNTRECEVRDSEGHWHLLRIHPYRSKENRIDGVVITLVDINDLKRNIAKLELASHYGDAIAETIREP